MGPDKVGSWSFQFPLCYQNQKQVKTKAEENHLYG